MISIWFEFNERWRIWFGFKIWFDFKKMCDLKLFWIKFKFDFTFILDQFDYERAEDFVIS